MARLALFLLGPFQVTLDGKPVTAFESDKVRALLAYLAVEADQPHRREKLAGLLWGERSDQDARRNLRCALSNLRKVIDDPRAMPSFLTISHQAIYFNSASDAWVDATAFVRLLESPAEAVHELEDALKLYRGDFLEGFSISDSVSFEEWALLQRERFHWQALSALHRLAVIYEGRCEYERALSYARRQVELDPWQEEAQRQVMRLLALSGQRAAALAQYEAFRRALAEELGVEPARATTGLYERIRDGKVGVDQEGERLPAGAAEPTSMPLSPTRRRLSRRMELALAGGGLATLAIVVALFLLVAGNALFGGEASVSSTLLPASGMPVEGKLVHVCEELDGDDSASPPQICVGDYRTGRRIQVTDDLAFDAICGLAWSPDGQQIVFGANPSGRTSRLYVINVDGSGLRQLTGDETPVTGPAWSPDGQWIVFTRRDDLWLVRPDGAELHALLAVEGFCLSRAVWSSDSQCIAFLQEPIERDSLHEEVWIVGRDGTAPRQIYAFERSEDEGVFLGWSPDGRRVGCFLLRPDGSTTLLIDADGSGEVQAMEGMLDSWLPEYWPPWGEER
jgi:DNA-binding SARP family transcriptional activator